MLPRPRLTPPAPDDVRLLDEAEPVPGSVPGSVPTLREILARYRQQGTAPGQLAAAPVPQASEPAEPAATPVAPQLKSLRSLFLDATGGPMLGPAAHDDAWTQPPPRRR
jgi:hypothetical protein